MTPTDNYIHQFFSRLPKDRNPVRLAHDYPRAAKVCNVVMATLGSVCLMGAMTMQMGMMAAVAGTALVCTAIVQSVFARCISGTKHTMSHHVHKEASYVKGGQMVGRVFYRGHLPVFEVDCESRFDAGEAHGYLFAKHIDKLNLRFRLAAPAIFGTLRPMRSPQVFAALKQKIPREFLEEMAGVAFGYNKWAASQGKRQRLTLDDVLLIHLLPEIKHFKLPGVEKGFEGLPVAACTAILTRNHLGEIVLGRIMDWCPFGDGGSAPFLYVDKRRGVAFLGVPGMIGAVTGFNERGLVAAMNVCEGKTETVRGMPSTFYNRLVLERARSVEEALHLSLAPLGPYHLTLTDAHNAGACVSFYQGEGGTHHVRRLGNDGPLFTLNWTYPRHEGNAFNSPKRQEVLSRYFQGTRHLDQVKLVDHALKLPYVNSWLTTQAFEFARGNVSISFDNGYAGTQPRETFPMSSFFNSPAA